MVVIPVGEQNVKARMKFWIESYLEGVDPQTKEEAAADNSPFVHDGHWHINPSRFNVWAASTGKDQFGVIKAELDFSAIGAEKVRYDVISTYRNKRKTLRPYKIPASLIPPPLMAVPITPIYNKETLDHEKQEDEIKIDGKSAAGN
jgi:hypothetical protein